MVSLSSTWKVSFEREGQLIKLMHSSSWISGWEGPLMHSPSRIRGRKIPGFWFSGWKLPTCFSSRIKLSFISYSDLEGVFTTSCFPDWERVFTTSCFPDLERVFTTSCFPDFERLSKSRFPNWERVFTTSCFPDFELLSPFCFPDSKRSPPFWSSDLQLLPTSSFPALQLPSFSFPSLQLLPTSSFPASQLPSFSFPSLQLPACFPIGGCLLSDCSTVNSVSLFLFLE